MLDFENGKSVVWLTLFKYDSMPLTPRLLILKIFWINLKALEYRANLFIEKFGFTQEFIITNFKLSDENYFFWTPNPPFYSQILLADFTPSVKFYGVVCVYFNIAIHADDNTSKTDQMNFIENLFDIYSHKSQKPHLLLLCVNIGHHHTPHITEILDPSLMIKRPDKFSFASINDDQLDDFIPVLENFVKEMNSSTHKE